MLTKMVFYLKPRTVFMMWNLWWTHPDVHAGCTVEKDLLPCPITREGHIKGRYKSGEITWVGVSGFPWKVLLRGANLDEV